MRAFHHALPPAPRRLGGFAALRIVLHRLKSSVVALVGIIFTIVGGVLLPSLTAIALRDRALARTGVEVAGHIVEKSASTRRDSRGETRRAYTIAYEFPVAGGRTWAAQRDISGSRWNTIQERDEIIVRYDADHPERNIVPGIDGGFPLIVALLAPSVFLVLGVVLLRVGSREVFGPVRLYRTGEAASGTVSGLEVVTNERINGRHPTRVRYSFRDREGREREGNTKTLDEELLDELREGTEVTVLYDPGSPTKSVLLAATGL